MPITFNADEAFAMAEQIERNGAAFYRRCAEINSESSGMLLKLAEMEDEHEKTFKQLHTLVSRREAEPTASDPDNEAAGFLKAMADGKVFDMRKDPAATLKGNEGLTEILTIAIGLEKDSIVFYSGLKELVGKAGGRDKVDAIIREEIGHIAWLNKQLPG